MILAPYIETESGIVTPQLEAAYKGQTFVFLEVRAWSGWPPDLLAWLIHRQGPTEVEKMVWWVRADLIGPAGEAVK
jgi:hypothetical protein